MTGAEYRSVLATLGLTQERAARILGVPRMGNRQTSRSRNSCAVSAFPHRGQPLCQYSCRRAPNRYAAIEA